ncbi:F510_1955 family glycosylhydrolase [Bacillus salitolerans]|uniref:F510_1955 family glycosylhydrolase n=1 Tax=Bacillus salitolerans TaxID=1437434 RepID=A0ABW4LPC6_9BACI
MSVLARLISAIVLLFSIPIKVFAHGSEEEHQREVFLNTLLMYGFYTLLVLVLISVVLLWTINQNIKKIDVKKQSGRKEKEIKAKYKKWVQASIGLLLLATIFTGAMAFSNENSNSEEARSENIDFMHIHGLGYTHDGNEIYVPAHDGLRVYKDGSWSIPEGEKHDYMGFSMVDNGFYSSGHPGPGSNLKNPFGVIKSTDMGLNIEIVDLYGEIDFHGMAVGYQSHAIYVFNPQKNSRMNETGLHFTLDETKSWNKSEMVGLEGQPSALAVHPTEKGTVVVTTNSGVYISHDFGDQFKQISPSLATAVSFTNDGDLVLGMIQDGMSIKVIDLKQDTEHDLSVPEVDSEDAISYIAVNPENKEEIVFTTYNRNIFLSKDFGEKWEQIAKDGQANSENLGTNMENEHVHHQGQSNSLDASWSFEEEPIQNRNQTLEIEIMDSKGKRVKEFDIEHEKLMHLIVHSEDLSVFQHLHPDLTEDGKFTVELNFPKGGKYKLIADVVPQNSNTTTLTKWINVEGENKNESVTVDDQLTKSLENKIVSLSFDDLTVNKDVTLTFNVKNQSGSDITNLEKYLGANGHVVIVSKNGQEYLHSHPMNAEDSGPNAIFMTRFPTNGIYKIWLQFKHEGELITVPYVIEVP